MTKFLNLSNISTHLSTSPSLVFPLNPFIFLFRLSLLGPNGLNIANFRFFGDILGRNIFYQAKNTMETIFKVSIPELTYLHVKNVVCSLRDSSLLVKFGGWSIIYSNLTDNWFQEALRDFLEVCLTHPKSSTVVALLYVIDWGWQTMKFIVSGTCHDFSDKTSNEIVFTATRKRLSSSNTKP